MTGFEGAVPKRPPSSRVRIDDEDLVARTDRGAWGRCDHPFRGSWWSPNRSQNPLAYYRNKTVEEPRADRERGQRRRAHFIFSSTAAIYGIPERIRSPRTRRPADQPLWLVETDDRADARVMPPRRIRLNFCALRYFNVAGADPEGRSGQSTAGATHLIKVAVEAALGKRACRRSFGTDYRHARRHRHSGLYPCHRPRRRTSHALENASSSRRQEPHMNCGYGRGFRCSTCSTRSTRRIMT